MKKSSIILLIISLLTVLTLASCNVDATDGLAEQVRSSVRASGTKILQVLSTNDINVRILSNKGIYTVDYSGNLNAETLNGNIKRAYNDGTYDYYLDNDGKLYKISGGTSTALDPDHTYSYLDSNGFLISDENRGAKINGEVVTPFYDTRTFEKLFTSGTNYYLGKISNDGGYCFGAFNSEAKNINTDKTIVAFAFLGGSDIFVVDSSRNIYKVVITGTDAELVSLNKSLTYAFSGTTSYSASNNCYVYNDGTNHYVIFKTSSAFEYLSSDDSFETVNLTTLTTKWASSLRSTAVAGFGIDSSKALIISTVNGGIWKVSSIDAENATRIFY